MTHRQGVYSEQILLDNKHLAQLEEKGYFISRTLDKQRLDLINNSYVEFCFLSKNNNEETFKPSVLDGNIDAIEYSRKEIDRIFINAFEKIFNIELVDFCGGVFLVKESGNDTHHSLHQDRALIDERLTFGLYSWTPITETDKNTGRLFVIPGSHKWGNHQRSLEINLPLLDEKKLLPLANVLDVEAGETVFFDTALMHGSFPNNSGKKRVAVNLFVKPKKYPQIHFAKNLSDESLLDIYEINPDFFFKQHFLHEDFRAKYKLLYSEKKLF